MPASSPSAPLPDSDIAHASDALAAIMDAVEREGESTSALALFAYTGAIRRQGQAIANAGGVAAMKRVLQKVASTLPEHAEKRSILIDAAWTGLPGWKL